MKYLIHTTKKLGALLLSGALLLTAPGFSALSTNATEAIEAEQKRTENEINDLTEKRKEAIDEAAAAQDNADALSAELAAFTRKLEDVNQKIDETKSAIGDTENNIASLEQELIEAKALEETQYLSMKERISYFYQRNMGRNLVSVFLECGSISDIINALVYLDAVMAYDRQMLKNYEELQQEIAAKQNELQDTKDSLSDYQAALTDSQSEMDELVGLKKAAAAEAADEAAIANMSVQEFNEQLAALTAKKEALQSQADAAQAELARQLAAQQEREEQERLLAEQASLQKQKEAEALALKAEEARKDAEAAQQAAEDARIRADALASAGADPAEIDAAAQAAIDAKNAADQAAQRAEEQQQNADNAKNNVPSSGGAYTSGSAAPGSVAVSESDILMLAATIQAEADNQGDIGRLAVGSVIMNRVESNKFPNTVPGVIQQNQQFATWRSGMVSLILQRGPNENCIRAARQAAAGNRVGTWLFFMTKAAADGYGITGYEQIGDHVFFWKWGAN